MNQKRALILRRDRAIQSLPSLSDLVRGTLIERHIRCGKPNCRCARGEGHRVYYLTTSFSRGRTEQITVPIDLVPVVEQWIANYHAWWDALEEVSAVNRDLLRNRWLERDRPKRR